MADETADIELDIEPDTGTVVAKPEDEIIVEKADETSKDEPKEPVVTVDEGLTRLKEQLENEQRARQDAEKRAAEAAQKAHQSQAEAQDSNLHLVINAISTVRQSNEILKSNLSAAYAASDFDTVSEIQMQMSENAAKLSQLEQGKQALESAPKQQAPQAYAGDPVEVMASQLSPRSADWIRRHPDYARDQRLTQRMLAAHNLAITDGFAADSDDYFDAIETTLRLRTAAPVQQEAPTSSAAEPTQRRSAPAAAPVSRSTSGTGTSTKGNRVTLTSAEREMAEMMGQTYEEYGRNKLALQREGKLH